MQSLASCLLVFQKFRCCLQVDPPRSESSCWTFHSSLNTVHGAWRFNKWGLQEDPGTFLTFFSAESLFSAWHDKVKQTADHRQSFPGFCGVRMVWQLQPSLKAQRKTNKYGQIQFCHFYVLNKDGVRRECLWKSGANSKWNKGPHCGFNSKSRCELNSSQGDVNLLQSFVVFRAISQEYWGSFTCLRKAN